MSDQITFEDRVKFHYFSLGSGRVTVAYQMDTDRESPYRSARFGFAFCSPKDFFSKGDYKVPVYGQVYDNKLGKNIKRIVSYDVKKGGRTLATEVLNSAPKLAAVLVPDGDNPVISILEEIEDICYEFAPSWRDKAVYRFTRSGNHEITRDGVKVVLTKEGMEMHTPWAGVIDL